MVYKPPQTGVFEEAFTWSYVICCPPEKGVLRRLLNEAMLSAA
jgi:hypothetical protein